MNLEETWFISTAKKSMNQALSELWTSRFIVIALIKRDLSSRYRSSFMGFAWAWARPLMQLFVYTVVIGTFLGASRAVTNFSLYLFVGLMFWGFFVEAISTGTASVVNGTGLVTKISFPREVLPISAVLIAFINLIIQSPILLLAILATNTHPNWNLAIYGLPIGFGFILFTTALALIFSSINVYIRDTQQLVDILLNLVMYLSPLIYSWTFVQKELLTRGISSTYFDFYMSNPITISITTFQDLFWAGNRISESGVAEIWISNHQFAAIGFPLFSLFLLISSYKLFLKLEQNFAREL